MTNLLISSSPPSLSMPLAPPSACIGKACLLDQGEWVSVILDYFFKPRGMAFSCEIQQSTWPEGSGFLATLCCLLFLSKLCLLDLWHPCYLSKLGGGRCLPFFGTAKGISSEAHYSQFKAGIDQWVTGGTATFSVFRMLARYAMNIAYSATASVYSPTLPSAQQCPV